MRPGSRSRPASQPVVKVRMRTMATEHENRSAGPPWPADTGETPVPHPTGETPVPHREAGETPVLQMPRLTRRDLLIRGGATVAVAGLSTVAAVKLYDPKGDAGLQQPAPIRLKNYFEKVEFPKDHPRISAAFG